MGRHVQWKTHKGKRILFVNGAGLSEAEEVVALEELKQELIKDRTGPAVLMNMANTSMTKATRAKDVELAAAVKAAGVRFGPTAVVGLTEIQKSVAHMSAKLPHYFKSVDEALEWLVKEEDKRHKG